MKYGLSVTGRVHPERILSNANARPGDLLVLTKPIGIGILATAGKALALTPEQDELLYRTMATLNIFIGTVQVYQQFNVSARVFASKGHGRPAVALDLRYSCQPVGLPTPDQAGDLGAAVAAGAPKIGQHRAALDIAQPG